MNSELVIDFTFAAFGFAALLVLLLAALVTIASKGDRVAEWELELAARAAERLNAEQPTLEWEVDPERILIIEAERVGNAAMN